MDIPTWVAVVIFLVTQGGTLLTILVRRSKDIERIDTEMSEMKRAFTELRADRKTDSANLQAKLDDIGKDITNIRVHISAQTGKPI